MRYLYIASLFCLLNIANAGEQKPTYRVHPKPRSFATGLLKHETKPYLIDHSFKKKEVLIPKSFHLNQIAQLAPIKDQGQCGSCVYNATVAALEDIYRIRSGIVPTLSRQFLMDCGAPWSCEGSFFEKVAGALLAQGGTPQESDYPYKAWDQKCQGKPANFFGKIISYKLISNVPQSIMAAIRAGYPVASTIGADSAFMQYDGGGTFNMCSNQATNHEIVIEGYDCETAVDSKGNCVFDANGRLPPGVGVWHARNSWGTSYGDKGWFHIKITSQSGALCNNIAEETGILEPAIAPPPPPPDPTPVPPVPPTPPAPAPMPLPLWMYLILGVLGVGLLVVGYVVVHDKMKAV